MKALVTAHGRLRRNDPETATLDLSMRGDPEGVRHIVEALQTNKVLTELNLRGNYLGDEGAQRR
jgi:hypothetical protein